MKICTVEGCEKRINGRGLCATHYSRWRLTGRVDIEGSLKTVTRKLRTREDLTAHLNEFRRIDPVTECWEWTRGVGAGGYGMIRFRGQNYRVHRLSAWCYVGLDLEDTKTKVCHRCDNPLCFNPVHLLLGSQAENIRDMDAKGRRVPALGGKNGRAKLSEAQVKEIFELRAARVSLQELWERYDISRAQLHRILSADSWAHLGLKKMPRIRVTRRHDQLSSK